MTGVQPTARPGQSTSGSAAPQPRNPSPRAQEVPEQQPSQSAYSPAVSLPVSLAHLQEGMRLEGIVVGRDAEGFPTLQTTSGAFTLLSGGDLAVNTRIVLRILGLGADLRAAMIEADGDPVRPPVEVILALTGAARQPAPPPVQGSAIPPPLPGGDGRPAAGGAPGPAPAGTEITAVLVKPAAADSGDSAPRGPWTGTPAGSATPRLVLRVVDPAAESGVAAPAAIKAAVPGALLSGTIVGQAPGGEPLLETSAGLIALQVRDAMPAGAALTVEVAGPAAASPPVHAGDGISGPPPLQVLDWPVLRDILAVLQAGQPMIAHRMLGATIPTADRRFASVVLSFFSALGGGDARRWLGREAVDALERAGRGDLVRKLAEEFGQSGRAAGDPGGGEWRTLSFPFYYGGDLHQVMLRHRRSGGGDDAEDEAGAAGTRFILEAVLDRLGPIRLDGLARQRRLDLYVRSLKALPPDQQGDIAGIFEGALSAAGMTGTLAFQQVDAFTEPGFAKAAAESAREGLVV